jgi:23S rRNA (adenine-N6)-dimethyltransferase
VAISQACSIRYTQNFLHSRPLVDRLVDASGVTRRDDVVEIGPGRGIITESLAQRCRRLVAVEKDPRLAGDLRIRLASYPNLEISQGDFLDFALPRSPYKVFASIPFNITAAIVGKLTSGLSPPDDIYLIVQREAALRYLGLPRETLVSVLLKPWFEPALIHSFRRTDFDPVPAVDVVMLRLRKRGPPLLDPRTGPIYRDFVCYCFMSRQPALALTLDRLLGRALSRGVMVRAGLPDCLGPSGVGFGQWLALFERVREGGGATRLDRIRGSEHRLQRQQRMLEKVHRTRSSLTLTLSRGERGLTGRP